MRGSEQRKPLTNAKFAQRAAVIASRVNRWIVDTLAMDEPEGEFGQESLRRFSEDVDGCLNAMEAAAANRQHGTSAETFARHVHLGQVDKAGAPYTGHLGRVAARARAHAEAMGLPGLHAEWCRQVGWLHDTIEDADVTADDLLDAGFDPAVVQAVQLLTRPKGKPYLECVAGIIASGDRLAMIVKLSDNEDNLDPARALPSPPPEHGLRYQRSAEMLRAALAPTPSSTARGRDA